LFGSTKPIVTATGVNVAQRHRFAGLREAAAFLEERVHFLACAREPLPERVRADLEDRCSLFARQVEDFAEDISEPMRAIEAHQHALRAHELHLVHHRLALGVVGRHGHRSGIERGIQLCGGRVERLFLHLEFGAVVEQHVGRQPVHPGSKPAVAAKLGELGHDPDENLLRRVAGVVRVTEDAARQREDFALDGAHNVLERIRIALLRLLHPLMKGCVVHRPLRRLPLIWTVGRIDL
jgi:hypothetical protein